MRGQFNYVSILANESLRARVLHRGAVAIFLVALVWMQTCSIAQAATLFHESFNGYWSFPNEEPENDPVNIGLPRQSKGADEFWYGARFEQADDNSSINSDLAVQKWGGGSNNSHTGRFSDDAGILFQISTLNLESAELQFDWRTFLCESPDLLKVGYFVGNLNFGGSRFADFADQFGNNWWNTNWVQLFSGRSNSWRHEEFPLPLGQASVWVAFWLDAENCDYGKIDNICVTGNVVVPEPGSLLLAAVGVAGSLVCGRRRLVASLRAALDRRGNFVR
jgi:hypothetical protein